MSARLQKRAVFAFHNVSFGYPTQPLLIRETSFAIPYGQTVALLASEGTGRSTILKLMMGMLEPTSGTVYVNEFPLSQLPAPVLNDYRAQVGFLFSKGALINNLSIFDNIALPLRYHTSADEDTIRAHVTQIMSQFRISPYQSFRPAFVSEHVRCLAGIARGLVLTPPALLVDNVFEGLSRRHVYTLQQTLIKVHQMSEGTHIFALSDPTLAQPVAERVLFFHEAQLYFDGTFSAFLESTDIVIKNYLEENLLKRPGETQVAV